MATAVTQPPWEAPEKPPEGVNLPPLRIWNSLTRNKEQFVPIDWENKTVKWYACGPTVVYDVAHLGHARNYVSSDVIRRVLVSYFHLKVKFVMNITDIDDKIIIRGRQQYLLNEYNQKRLDTKDDINQIRLKAFAAYLRKNLPDVPVDTSVEAIHSSLAHKYGGLLEKGPTLSDAEAKTRMYIHVAQGAATAMNAIQANKESSQQDLDNLDDVLMSFLDQWGSTVDSGNLAIWTSLTKKYEDLFFEDMRALNVMDPTEVVRVTDYVPFIVNYIQEIVSKGFAYAVGDESSQSVYFDIKAFEAAGNNYARLEPWNRNDKGLQADGEGALAEQGYFKHTVSDKHAPSDFALFKSSKPGEPSWPSPWGPGRPGWHIECSAMASDKLGSQLDIHSGGIDLAFPHHDAELAQSEAFWNERHKHQWINYFIHIGHLSIQGSKMSKSLKNFTTIRSALAKGDYTARSLRIIFLLGAWGGGIEITDSLIKEATAWEDRLNNFFLNARAVSEEITQQNGIEDTKDDETDELVIALEKAKTQIYESLCDNIHTPSVMSTISSLIGTCNSADKSQATPQITVRVARYITSLVNIFGLNGTAGPDDEAIGWSGIDVPEDAKLLLHSLSRKRDSLRTLATTGKISSRDLEPVPYPYHQKQQESKFENVLATFNERLTALNASENLVKDVMHFCDFVRDRLLFERGIYLEDREDKPALVRPVTKELREAKQAQENRALQKQKAKEEREKEAAAKAEKGRLSHNVMFRTEEYNAWDADGIPTHEKGGEELTKSKRKKMQKDWERQKKLHEAWLKTSSG